MKVHDFYNKVTNSYSDIIKEFLALLDRNRIDYAVIGGVGINAYCEPIVTLDFDCIILKEKIDGLRKELRKAGFRVKTHPHTYKVTHRDSDIRIQIQRDERFQGFLKNVEIHQVFGYEMKVARKEDLVLSKIWASYDKERSSLKRQKDKLDIQRLVDKYPSLKKIVDEIGNKGSDDHGSAI